MNVIGTIITIAFFTVIVLVAYSIRKVRIPDYYRENSMPDEQVEYEMWELLVTANTSPTSEGRQQALSQYEELHDMSALRFAKVPRDIQQAYSDALNNVHAAPGSICRDWVSGRQYVEPGFEAIVERAQQENISWREAERLFVEEGKEGFENGW